MQDKERNNYLIRLADDAIKTTPLLFTSNENTVDIQSGYNGQIAALGISIATSGLRPALAIYYRDKANDNRKVNRQTVLEVIAKIITEDKSNNYDFTPDKTSNEHTYAKKLFEFALKNDANLLELQQLIIDSSIALKQVIRTYNMI